jgi:hypothetical protein
MRFLTITYPGCRTEAIDTVGCIEAGSLQA